MASFFAHGFVAGATAGWLSKNFKVLLLCVIVFFVLGTVPDTADWVAWQLGWQSQHYGAVYGFFHGGLWADPAARWWLLLPHPMGLHIILDLSFHAGDPHWWPRLWWAEVLMDLGGGGIVAYRLIVVKRAQKKLRG